MRPLTNFALHAALAAALTALAVTGAAASPDGTSKNYLKIDLKGGSVAQQAGGHKDHKGEIEVLSYSWGAAPAGDKEHEVEMDLVAGQAASPPRGGVRVAAGDVDGDGRAEVGASKTETIGAARTRDAASGQATGKRQHMPIRSRTYYDQSAAPAEKRQHDWRPSGRPAARGTVWVRVATPWTDCRVGTRYPSIELGSGTQRHLLQDVVVRSCGRSAAADDRPTEEVAFYYNRIAFNYAGTRDIRWDKTQE